MGKVIIVDTTLRDGEQAAGIAFNSMEKVSIAKMLDRVGVEQFEIGIPAMGREEQKVIFNILNLGLKARLLTWNRLSIKDIRASIECGANFVHISAPVSDIHIKYKLNKKHDWVLGSLRKCIWFARNKGCQVSVGAEDASRAEFPFLVKFAHIARAEGAERLRFADTVGVLDPFSTYEKIKELIEATGIDLEIHAHNDFGMATANTLAAIKGGCRFVSTTVNGIGERAGNAPMQEVVRALKKIYNVDCNIDGRILPLLSRLVAKASNNLAYRHIP